jgi:hypothetical protein
MFNLAIDWELYRGANPVRKVKFFQELTRARVLREDEERKLLRNATPYIQELLVSIGDTLLSQPETHLSVVNDLRRPMQVVEKERCVRFKTTMQQSLYRSSLP